MNEDVLRATAQAWLVARGETEAAAALSRARLEILADRERWSVEGRAVDAIRVALWLDAAGRVLAEEGSRVASALRAAIAAAAETPATALREVVLLLERSPAPRPPGPGYRDPASPRTADGPTVAASAAAYLAADGDAALAAMLGRSETALDTARGGVARVVVSLDAADLARLRREPGAEARLRAALEVAARSTELRVPEVAFALRAGEAPPDPASAEAHFTAAARTSGWEVVPVSRDEDATVVACVKDGRIVIVRIDRKARAWEEDTTRAARITLPAADLADEDAALRAVARLAG